MFFSASLDIDITSVSRKMNVFFYSHSEVISGCKIVWIGARKENPKHYRVSSIVSLKMGQDKPSFCQIIYFFRHTFKGNIHRFAVITIFDSKFTTAQDGG